MSVIQKKQGYRENSFWFLYKGEKISENDTPEKMKMENGDKILIVMKKPN